MGEVADLFVILRAETAPFTRSLKLAAEEGETFTGKMGGVGNAFNKIGAATTFAAAGVVVASVKMASDFQAETNVLVTAAGEAQANLGKVRDGILQISSSTGTSWKTVTDGMYQAEKAGFDYAHGGLDVVRAAAQGAREEGAPLNDVVSAMTKAMNNYNLPASRSVQVMNAIKTAAGMSTTTFAQFAASLQTVLPITGSLHMSLDKVMGALAVMTQHGETARHGTQLLFATIRNLSAPTNVMAAEMYKWGISAQDVQSKLGQRGVAGTLQYLSQTVLNNMGPAGAKLRAAFSTSGQAAQQADQMFAKMPPNLQSLAKAYKNATMSGPEFAKATKDLAPLQKAQLTAFEGLTKKADGFTSALKKGGPDAESYNSAIKKMTGGASGLQATLETTGASYGKVQGAIGRVGTSLNDNAKDVEGWKSTSQLLSVQMAQLKQTADSFAIQLGTKLIPIIQAVIGFFAQHKTATTALAGVIGVILTGSVIKFLTSALTPYVKALGGISKVAQGAWQGMQLLKQGFDDARVANSAFSGVMGTLGGKLRTAVDGVKGLASSGWDKIASGASAAGSKVSELASAGWDGLKSAGSTISDLASAGWSKVVGGVQALGGAMKTAALGALEFSRNTLTAMVSAGRAAVAFVAEKVALIATAVAEKAAAAAEWLLNLALDANPIMLIVIAIAALVGALIYAWTHFAWFRGMVEGAFNAIATVTLWLWHVVFEPGFKAIGKVATWLWQNVIVPAFHGMMQTFSTLAGAASAAFNWIISAGKTAANWLMGLPGKILSWFADAGKWLWNAGVAIIQGLWNGIQSMGSWIAGQIMGLIKAVVPGPVLHILGINSPSKVFHEIGVNVTKGLVNGINSGAPHAAQASSNLALAVAGGGGFGLGGSGRIPALSGGGGGTVVQNIHLEVHGSVKSRDQLRDDVQKLMLQMAARNSQTWQNYRR